MITETKQILEKLDMIKSELDYIKGHIVDVDVILTEEDIKSLQEAEEDLIKRQTKRLN